MNNTVRASWALVLHVKVLTLFHILSYGVVRVHQADGKPTQIQKHVQEVLFDNLVLVKGLQDVLCSVQAVAVHLQRHCLMDGS